MSDIPPEIIDDILCPLPVKSLLRFRRVCKSWKALIDSPKFNKAHIKRQQLVKPNSDMKLILKGDSFFGIDFSSICSRSPNQPQELDHPWKLPNGPIEVVGCCNGLVFMSNYSLGSLWNPTTKMFRELPDCHIESPEDTCFDHYCAGFGYDSSSDDYKVVRTAQSFLFEDSPLISQTWIYSLKSDLWNKVQEGCPYLLKDKATFVGGALHWVAARETQSLSIDSIVIGFNLSSERFQEVPCPENFGEHFLLNLAVLGECLCLFTNHLSAYTDANDFVVDNVDIWVMKDYGVKESWMKLFSVEQLVGRQHINFVRPKAYSVCGKEVLLEMDSKFWWYNLETKSLEPVKFNGRLKFSDSHVCLGTLVPLYKGSNECVRKKNTGPNKETGAKSRDKGDDFLKKGFKLKL